MSIMSWAHSEFSAHQFSAGSEAYEPQAYTMSLSPVSASVSVSASPGAGLQQQDIAYRNEYTPRFQPDPFAQAFQHQQYHAFEAYSCNTSPTTTRGRSSSGDTNRYISTPPTPPEAGYLNGVSGHYAVQSNQQMCSDPVASAEPYLTRSPPNEEHGDKTPRVTNDRGSPSSDKTVTKKSTEMWCLHSDCLNEEGVPQRRFSRKADVSRHYSSQHNPKYMDCPRRNCARKGKHGFTRKDHLVEHLRGFHMETIAKRETSVKVIANEESDDKANSRIKTSIEQVYGHELPDMARLKHEGEIPLQGQLYPMETLQISKPFDDQAESQRSRLYAHKAKMLARRQLRKDQTYLYPAALDLENGSQNPKRIPVKQERKEPETITVPREVMEHAPSQTQSPVFNMHQDMSPRNYTPNPMAFPSQYSTVVGYNS